MKQTLRISYTVERPEPTPWRNSGRYTTTRHIEVTLPIGTLTDISDIHKWWEEAGIQKISLPQLIQEVQLI